ncbi:PspC domain-containing protein [Nonomuraea fuscirosea]|uniref:PspC domain-containing protein n=1 Tax=Nonomuraea fuscirosea TaxID=1291556 RepID=UPI003425A047
MTEAPPRQPAAPPRELRRSSEGRFLMGVCAGLGRYTGIDPVVFRVGVAVLLLGSGAGLLLYLAAFLLMKEPSGRPGFIEQWTRRDFDAEAVMALLTAVLAFGLALNLATVWLDTGTLVVGVFLAVSLLAAHSSGVDLLGLARSMPERLLRRQGERPAAHFSPAPPTTAVPRPAPAREGMDEAVPSTNADESVMSAGAGREPAADRDRPPAAAPAPAETTAAAAMSAPEDAAPQVGEAPESATPAESAAPVREAREAASIEELRAAADSAREAAYQARQAAREDRDVSPEAVTAEHAVPGRRHPDAVPGQQRPAYRPDPPAARDYSSYGEPFAPNGPYQPLDPAKRAGGYSPYDPALYGRPIPPKKRERRPTSYIGAITILLAIIIGGIVVAVQANSAGGVSPTVVGGAMLITVGAGLLIAAWWGRGAGLVAAGTAIALIVAMGLVLGGLPRNIGPAEWTPTSLAEANQLYDVGLGDGRLDLSELRLPPGTHVTFNAAVSAGELVVIVPPTARVEVHATNKIGDIVIDQSLKGGVQVRSDKVLEPETKPEGKVSTIVLNLRGGVGDMEVRRAA